MWLAASVGWAQYLEAVIPVGDTPDDIVWNATSNKVYTPNYGDGTVSVIDGATNQIRATIRVADYASAVCWNSVANKVYCASIDPDWLSVIDGVGDTLIRKVRMRGAPTRMVFNPAMNKLYVVCIDDHMVRVYDGSADTLVGEVWFGEITDVYTVLWHPASNRLFCATYCGGESDTVFVIDCSMDVIDERRPVGRQPYAMCRNPVNNFIYLATQRAVYVLSSAGDTVVTQIPGYANDLCAVPFPNKVYALASPGLRVIDCYTHTVIDSVTIAGGVFICDTLRAKVYSACEPAPVIDARADTVLDTLPMGRSPECICWNSTNSRVYINDNMDDVVYVIRDTSTGISEPARSTLARRPLRSTISRGSIKIRDGFRGVVYDAAGSCVLKSVAGAARRASLNPGAYFVRYDDADEVEKFVVVK